MKITKLVTLVTVATVLMFAATGCKKKPVNTTVIPGQGAAPVEPVSIPSNPLPPGNTITPIPRDGGGSTGLPTAPPITTIGGGPTGVSMDPPIKPEGTDGFGASTNDFTNWPQDRSWGEAFTVHFDFDRSVVKASEGPKLDGAAAKFKSAAPPKAALLIEGHCDERGTVEYNRALGERRALAIREYLVRAGLNPERITTATFGKDKPVAFGHDESAWSKNRRGEIILLTPPK